MMMGTPLRLIQFAATATNKGAVIATMALARSAAGAASGLKGAVMIEMKEFLMTLLFLYVGASLAYTTHHLAYWLCRVIIGDAQDD